jgi:hypothetical protein
MAGFDLGDPGERRAWSGEEQKPKDRQMRRGSSTREVLDMKNSVIVLMMAAGLTASAFAQPKGTTISPAPMPQAKAPGMAAPQAAKFADDEMTQVAAALTGSWKCSINGSPDVVISISPVVSKDMPDLLYAEVARGDALDRPYRQAIWQLHRVKDKLRLKTMEFRRERGEMLSASGLWAAPDQFPSFGSDDVITTLDIDLTKTGNAWKGKTPHSYPTSMGGAVEMTSDISISPTEFITNDRGTDASGKEVWPVGAPNGYKFTKFDAGVKVHRLPNGVVVIDYPGAAAGPVAKNGDKVMVHYTGYIGNGWMFDSSHERGIPLTHTLGGKYNFIAEGFRAGMMDAQKGLHRKLVIPGHLGFGEAGELHGKVPANATLYVDMEVVDVVAATVGAVQGNANPEMKPMNAEEVQKIQEAKRLKAAGGAPAAPVSPPKR